MYIYILTMWQISIRLSNTHAVSYNTVTFLDLQLTIDSNHIE